MSKVDQVIHAMPPEAAQILKEMLTRRSPDGSKFVVSAPKIADLVTAHTSENCSKDSILAWRKKNV